MSKLNIGEAGYVVKRTAPGNYRIFFGRDVSHRIYRTANGFFWKPEGDFREFTRLRDAIIQVVMFYATKG